MNSPTQKLLESQHFTHFFKPAVDVRAGRAFQSVEAEVFDRETGRHRGVDHRFFDRLKVTFFLGGEVAHKRAGKAVARAGRLDDFPRRVCRENAHFPVFVLEKASVRALLDDDETRPHRKNRVRTFEKVGLPRQKLRFRVVQDQTIDLFQTQNYESKCWLLHLV